MTMSLSLDELFTNTPSFWRRTKDTFDLAAKTKLEIRIKAQNGEWETLLDAQVPNNKMWTTMISVQADETDEPPA